MNRRVLKLAFKSLNKRKREILRSCITTFVAMFFIAGILLLQENIYQWQMAQNKQRFGDWFLRESASDSEPSEELLTNAYLNKPSSVKRAVNYYTDEWKETDYIIGSMTEEFIKQGNLRLSEGSWPAADYEVVMDYNTLIQSGYSTELGQTITLRYYLNGNSNKDADQREETFTLVGILNNYTNVWKSGASFPAFVVTEDVVNRIQEKSSTVYIYALKSYVRTDDFETVYKKMTESLGKRFAYNENVYNYKPWGSPFIYNYVYILVMFIGIIALTYQIWGYQRSRMISYHRMRRLGATKHQIIINVFLENILILIPAGVIGVAVACLVAKLIGSRVGIKSQIDFFYIGADVLLKCALSILIAVLVQELLNHLVVIRQIEKSLMTITAGGDKVNPAKARSHCMQSTKESMPNRVTVPRSRVSRKNITGQIHKRLVRENGAGQNIAVRIFTLAITVILLLCAWNIKTAFDAYEDNKNTPDLVGFKQEAGQIADIRYYLFYNAPQKNNIEGEKEERIVLNSTNVNAYKYYLMNRIPISGLNDFIDNSENRKNYDGTGYYPLPQSITFTNRKYAKDGNTSSYVGIADSTINEIRNMSGIADISLSSFDTSRTWLWENQDLDQMGGEKLCQLESSPKGSVKDKKYGQRYLFATEFVEPTEKLYQRLSKYIEPDQMNYEAFKNGEQAVVFLQENANGKYDQTLKAGDTITYQYDQVATSMFGFHYYGDEWQNYLYPNTDIILPFGTYNESLYKYNKSQEPLKDQFYDSDEQLARYRKLIYRYRYQGTDFQAAAVVKLTDQIKEELADVLVDYGQYTAIASSALAKKAIQNQKDFMKESVDIAGTSFSEEYYDQSFHYNQISVIYNLSSTFSVTDNILQSYLKSMNYYYATYSAKKETYRIKTLNAILQYGITMLAAIVVDLLIGAILVKNRMAARKKKFLLMIQMGSDRSRIRKVCILEVLRESVWCIFTAPLKLVIYYVMYRRGIQKL